jgi:hypothetical protein
MSQNFSNITGRQFTGTEKFYFVIFFSAGQKGLLSRVICLPEEAERWH